MKVSQYVPSLGSEVLGEYDDHHGLVYFRGIPYATVQERWTHSEVLDSLESPFDATQFGPRCVQEEGAVLVSGGTNDPTPGDDEFKCLNLNITVPKECLRQMQNGHTKTKVPVMFWIHGGGFKYGANSVARYRPHKLCSMARELGQPIILVQIGYRLGALGFAASNDLDSQEDTRVHNGDIYRTSGNYGFIDQRNALHWVQKHIRGFGGDADNVTAFGISAGSASVHYHILTGNPMFDRAICMSGSAPTLGPLPFDTYDKAWKGLSSALGLQDLDITTRLLKLRSIPPMQILQNYSSAALGPLGDGTILPNSWAFEQSKPSRCKSLIIGDTNVEAIILDGLFRRIGPGQFRSVLQSILTQDEVHEFCQIFGVETSVWEAYRDAMRRFMSIMMFQFPNLRIAETFKGDAYAYHFEEQSIFSGPTFGISYHGQCALMMYCVENEVLPPESQRVATIMAQQWIEFAHDNKPWQLYREENQFMRFGPHGQVSLETTESDRTRQYDYFEWVREHFESLKEVARVILNGE